ncbi:MAG: hypothetical protein RLZZ300_1745, partial [Pseudomonadota bacterium]
IWLISEGLMLLCRTERGIARTH